MRGLLGLIVLLLWCGIADAAIGTLGGRTPLPQISYNIVTNAGAACNGDHHTYSSRTTSITSGTKILTVTASTFVAGDAGKTIVVPGMNSLVTAATNTIFSVDSPTQVTLATNSLTTLSSVVLDINVGTDDAPAFATFNTWARANQGSNQVVLNVPNGSVCWIASAQVTTQPAAGLGSATNAFFMGINSLIVEGTGATIDSTGGAQVAWGAAAQIEQGLTAPLGRSARIQTATASASTVTLTSASYSAGYISRFTVGTPVMISGMDIQSGYNQNFGVPSNHQIFNYAIVTGVCNNTGACLGTATVTFDRPLTYGVLDTWPEYYAGGVGQLDQGGPATIYALHPFWNGIVEYRGLTILDDYQSYAKIRNVTFRNVTWNSPNGTVPSGNETFTVRNSVLNSSSAGWEVDKLIGTLDIDGLTGAGAGSVVRRIDFQSSSTNLLILKNASIGSMFGTPKSSQITDTHFDLFRPGAWTNGVSTGSLVCTRCDVTDFQQSGGLAQTFASSAYSMSGGVVTVANANNTIANGPPHRIFVPGGNVYFSNGASGIYDLLQTTTQTQDATNVYTQTSQAGGFPGVSGYSVTWRVHPAPQFTCDACTGSPEIIGVNTQNGATALAPLGQFGYRSYAPTVNSSTIGTIPGTGKLVSLTINVTVAGAGGAGTLVLNPTGQFLNNMMDQATWTTFNWFPTINLKQAGIRVITPSGATCDTGGGPVAGGCSGDTISAPSGGSGGYPPSTAWLSDGILPSVFGSSFPTGWTLPQFTLTLRTNQGVVP